MAHVTIVERLGTTPSSQQVILGNHPYFQGSKQSLMRASLENNPNFISLTAISNVNGFCIVDPGSARYSFAGATSLSPREFSTGHLNLLPRALATARSMMPSSGMRISGAILSLQRNGTNYFHFATEIAPAIFRWSQSAIWPTNSPRIVVTHASAFAGPLLKKILPAHHLSLVPPYSFVRFRDCAVAQSLPARFVPSDLLLEVADCITKSSPGGGASVVYLSRLPTERRNIKNHDAVLAAIRHYFPQCSIVFPGQLTFDEQVRATRDARIIIAQHGAQATNLLWAQNLEAFVELRLGSEFDEYSSLALLRGAQYFGVNRLFSSPKFEEPYRCNIDELAQVLTELRSG